MSAAQPLVVLADTREKTIPPFPDGVVIERATLPEGDYSTPLLLGIAAIERKGGDFESSLTWDRPRVDREMQRLQTYPWKCIVVEDDITSVYRSGRMHPHALLGSIASLYARWDIPVLFVGNAAGAGRLIAGLLRRWEERLTAEREAVVS